MVPEAKICSKCRSLFKYDQVEHKCGGEVRVLQPLYSKWQLESLLDSDVEVIIATILNFKNRTTHVTIRFICDHLVKLIRSKEFVKSKLKFIERPISGNSYEICQYCGGVDDLHLIHLVDIDDDISSILACCCCRYHLRGKYTL